MEKTSKIFEFEIRAEHDDEHGDYISGRPIVFNEQTDMCGYYGEVIERGALDSTDLQDVRFLIGHDTSMVPLARSRRNNANSTMQMQVDAEGMAIRVNLDTENNSEARSLYSATKRGDISGMSFMFTVDGDEWTDLDSDYPIRHIRSIKKVFEVSAVAFPAYEQTSLEARAAEAVDTAKATLENEKALQRDNQVREEIKNLLKGESHED